MTTVKQGPDNLTLFYIINGLGPGGAERSMVEMLPFFLANDIRPVVICMRPWAQGVESEVHRLGCELRFLRGGMISHVRALRRMLRSEVVDLVHTTLFESDVVGRFAAMGTGVPVLTSLVNTTYVPVRLRDPNVNRVGLWACQTLDGFTARHLTAHFHAISDAVCQSAVQTLGIPAERITVIRRGRDPERLGSPSSERRHAARSRLGLADDDEVIVNVARQEYQKGQRFLLEAASVLAHKRPRMVVLIVGREGHTSRELVELHNRLQLREKVRFLGHRDDVPEVLAAADLFVFPSVYEGLGTAVIEAMALGLPIVASDLPALREVIDDQGNGFLVKPESSHALATALATILDDCAIARSFAKRSIELFRERFTIERSADSMVELYRRIVQRPTTLKGAAHSLQAHESFPET